MNVRLAAAVCLVGAALAGCSGGEPESDYYDEMREIEGFEDSSDASLDELADSACELIESAVEAGETNEQAVDRVFDAALELGLTDADALTATISIVGNNCPIDISE